jgi:mannose-1-phosphate guanylyltransferase
MPYRAAHNFLWETGIFVWEEMQVLCQCAETELSDFSGIVFQQDNKRRLQKTVLLLGKPKPPFECLTDDGEK